MALELWYGSESYLIKIAVQREIELVLSPEMNVSMDIPLDEAGYQSCYTEPFLADKRLLVFRLENLKNPYIKKLQDKPTENKVVLIADSVDKRLAVFKGFEKSKIRQFEPLNEEKFDGFLKSRIRHFEVPITNIEEYTYIKDRIKYGERPYCNLFTVENYLKALAGLGSASKEVVDEVIPKYVSENNFALFPYLVRGDKKAYYELLNEKVSGADAIGTLSLLLYYFRISYKVKLVGKENAVGEIGVSSYQLKDILDAPLEMLKEAMSLCQEGVNKIKRGEKDRDVLVFTSAQLFDLLERKTA